MMPSSFPPPETQPSKLEQARERLADLFIEADRARDLAHEASIALESGDYDAAAVHVAAAEKVVGILPARHKWAELALTAARAEVTHG